MKYILFGTDSEYQQTFDERPTPEEIQDFMDNNNIRDVEDVALFRLGKELKLKKTVVITDSE